MGGFPREFPPQMTSPPLHVLVYVASFWSANEHLLTPHGHVFHASLWGPIRMEAPPIMCQMTATCLALLLHSSPGFHTDNITINLQKMFNLTRHQSTISRVTNQRHISLAMSNFPDPPYPYSVSVFTALQLTFKLILWSMSTIFQLHDINNVPFLFFHR